MFEFLNFLKGSSKDEFDINTDAEDKLDDIKRILFPPLVNKVDEENGETITYVVDYAVDTNLEAALTDLEDGINDDQVRDTIKVVLSKLVSVRATFGLNRNIVVKTIDEQ
jgi:hypothetical protein